MWPYVTLVGGGVSTSVIVGKKKGKEGKINYKASLASAGGATASSALCNTTIESNYHSAIERHRAEASEAYVKQLSDEELERVLMKFDLLEKEEKNDVKVL